MQVRTFRVSVWLSQVMTLFYCSSHSPVYIQSLETLSIRSLCFKEGGSCDPVFVDTYMCKWGRLYCTHNFQCKLQSSIIWEVPGVIQVTAIGLGTLVFSQWILHLFSVTVQMKAGYRGYVLSSLIAGQQHAFFYIL